MGRRLAVFPLSSVIVRRDWKAWWLEWYLERCDMGDHEPLLPDFFSKGQNASVHRLVRGRPRSFGSAQWPGVDVSSSQKITVTQRACDETGFLARAGLLIHHLPRERELVSFVAKRVLDSWLRGPVLFSCCSDQLMGTPSLHFTSSLPELRDVFATFVEGKREQA